MTRVIAITDDRGKYLLADDELEPHPGSVVLIEGVQGMAWQRWGSDGMWHQCGRAKAASWPWVKHQRRVVLVHDAPERV